jgi:hypothetical protein
MVPDRGFTKQLTALDPELRVLWDWGSEKWEIWRFPSETGKEPFHCLTVQTKDKSYRELGSDILIKLQAGDPWRYSYKDLVRYWDEMDNQIIRRKRERFKQKMKDIAMDTFMNIHCKIIQVPEKVKVRRAIANAY